MKRLNEKQRKILDCLSKKYPSAIKSEIILEKLNFKEMDILTDIKLLIQNGLVTGELEIGKRLPIDLTITPYGIEKKQENVFTRLRDSAWENPLGVIAIIIALLAMVSNIYINETAGNIQVELNEVKDKIAEYDILFAKNTTGDAISVLCFNGTKPQIKLNDNRTTIICE